MDKQNKKRFGRTSSPKWGRYGFFVMLILVAIWVLPSSFKLFKGDYLLMSAKYNINQWVASEEAIDLIEWNKTSVKLKRANSIAPDNPEILLYLGNLYAVKGFNYAPNGEVLIPYLYEAADYYAKALELKPVDPLLWVNYAKILYVVAPESDDFKDALYNAKLLGGNEKYLKKIIDELTLPT